MERSGRVAIIVSIALVLIAWQIPYGRLVIYPLSLLGTYVHEMGHGLTALVLGADFERLVMFPDGSGFAEWRGDVGRLARGAIAAGGLVGPSLLGGVIVASSRKPRLARPLLMLSSLALGLTALFFAGSLFTWAFVLAWAAVLGVGARVLGTTACSSPSSSERSSASPSSRTSAICSRKEGWWVEWRIAPTVLPSLMRCSFPTGSGAGRCSWCRPPPWRWVSDSP